MWGGTGRGIGSEKIYVTYNNTYNRVVVVIVMTVIIIIRATMTQESCEG